ncbi:MAG: DUF3078 domain-containing protein [bacterium]
MKRLLALGLGCSLSLSAAWAAPAATPSPTVKSVTTAAPVSLKSEWQNQIIVSFNLNQASFNNWAQGGTDLVSGGIALNARFVQDNSNINWLNTLKFQYGLTYLANQGTQISADSIDLESLYAWKTWAQVNPYVSVSVQSQFGPGYDYSVTPSQEISNFMDPGYFTESAGLKYTPTAAFYTRVGLGVKETFANQFQSTYSVNPDTGNPESVLTQAGLDWVSELNQKLFDNTNLDSKLDAFWPGESLNLTVLEWDNLLRCSLNKIMSLNVEGDLRYDSKVYNGVQVKETLSLSFNDSLL